MEFHNTPVHLLIFTSISYWVSYDNQPTETKPLMLMGPESSTGPGTVQRGDRDRHLQRDGDSTRGDFPDIEIDWDQLSEYPTIHYWDMYTIHHEK